MTWPMSCTGAWTARIRSRRSYEVVLSTKKRNTLRLTRKTVLGIRLRIRRGTTKVPRTLQPVPRMMNAPITPATTRTAMP